MYIFIHQRFFSSLSLKDKLGIIKTFGPTKTVQKNNKLNHANKTGLRIFKHMTKKIENALTLQYCDA